MKKLVFIFLGMALLTTTLFSQRDETLFGSVNFKLSGIWGGGSSQITQFGENISQLSSTHLGLEFGKTVFIGWKGYRFTDNVRIDEKSTRLRMYYGGLVVEVLPFAWKAIHPKIGFMGGLGNVRVDGTRDWLGVLQPSAGIELNVFRWLRVGAEGGYRFANVDNTADISNSDVSTPYGEISIKFGGSWGRGRY